MAEADPNPSSPDGAAAAAAAPAGELPAPIIVKKITIAEAGHHGGAWKVAYADFVTAMMAFFLLLWLLGSTTEDQRKGLADYFTPTLVKVRQQSAGADGMLGGSSLTDVDNYPHSQGQTGTKSITIPRGATGGPVEGGGRGEQQEQRASELREEIERRLEAKRQIRHLARQVRVMRSPEGVRIDLVDDANFSMFTLGTTVLTNDAGELLEIISAALADNPAPLIVRGHTDSLPWRAGVAANNWSLSAGRAEATRQALMNEGLPEGSFARIEGVADREPLIADDPGDPRNRRISILLLESSAAPVRRVASRIPNGAGPGGSDAGSIEGAQNENRAGENRAGENRTSENAVGGNPDPAASTP